MERKVGKQLNMVSRLPKFSSRPPGTTATPVPQGSALSVSSVGGKAAPLGRHNSSTRVPALKWKKTKKETELQANPPVTVMNKPSPAAAVKIRSAVPTTQSSPRTIPQPNKPRLTAHKRPSAGPPLSNGTATLNGVSGVNKGFESWSSGTDLGHLSQQRSLESDLSQSSDGLKSKENIVRSQSFTHFKRTAAPASPPMTRSFSFNKATELAKELPRPLAQSPVAKSPPTNPVFTEERVGECGTERTSVTSSVSSLSGATVKKSLLPNILHKKPSTLSYKLTRPSLTKYSRPAMTRPVQNEPDLSEKVPAQIPETSSEPTSNTESAETTPDQTSSEAREVERCTLGPFLEVLEDMSLSSTSSLEHNDTSEEYMDDFDNLGNGGEILLLPALTERFDHLELCEDDDALITQCDRESSVTSLHSFLSETVDWAGMNLTADRDGFEGEALSPVGDFPHGSSLDLSPSDSSGGTYMWDEEGLDGLGGSGHPCGSYDSDLNSMDILNNLENVESCDLEDDDLMLDVDLHLEDASLHSDTDGMSHYECSETGGRLSRRSRRQQCWGRKDQFCCENRSGILQSFDGCQGRGLDGSGSDHVMLDEVTLKHMAQDCSFVKAQLLELRTLLQMEANGSAEEASETPDTPDSTDESLIDQKVEMLLREVQELKDELRIKERMISELEQQVSSPVKEVECHCQQVSESDGESAEHQDKSTQTPWGTQNPQILQAPGFVPTELHNHERLSSPAPAEALCDDVAAQTGDRPLTPQFSPPDLQSPIPVDSGPNFTASTVATPAGSTIASSSRTLQNSDPDQLSFMSSNFKISQPARPLTTGSFCCLLERGTQNLGPLGRSSFLTLHPPNYIKRASTLIKPQEGHRVSMITGALGPSRTRHQPLPAHRHQHITDLSTAQRAAIHTPTVAPIYNPQKRGLRQFPFHRETEISLPRARVPLQPSLSRLPKPKSH